jgi:hypothetical protein
MSLFTATSATPERVWGLAMLLLTLGGRAERSLVAGLLDPRFEGGRKDETESDAFKQTVQAAVGLDLVKRDRDMLELLNPRVAESLATFADDIHTYLCAPEFQGGDSLVLAGFAVLVGECDLEGGSNWLLSSPREALVDRLNARLIRGNRRDEAVLNTSRLTQWFRWLSFLGLATGLGGRGERPYPYVAPRLARELASAARPPDAAEIPAREFLSWIALRMPYLDGGAVQRELLGGAGSGSGGRVSLLISIALRDLHDDGMIRLITSGDAGDNVLLTEDKYHNVRAFRAVALGARTGLPEGQSYV